MLEAPQIRHFPSRRLSSAALAARVKAITVRLANAIVHRDMGTLLWLGTTDTEAP
jgi:hypothetical protein